MSNALAYLNLAARERTQGQEPTGTFHRALDDFEATVRHKPAFWEGLANHSLNRLVGSPILVALTGGRVARGIENSADGEVVAETFAVLREMFGGAVLEATSATVTR